MKTNVVHAFVYPVSGRPNEVRQLEAFVKGACLLSCEQVGKPEAKKCLKGAHTFVVLICPEVSTDSLAAQLAEDARRAGKRIVAVWAPGVPAQSLPAFVNQYADAVIPLDAIAVAAAVCGEEVLWQMPDGSPRPTPPTPRHKGK
jgi:hypothetical protein